LAYIVAQLHSYYLSESDTDVKGKAYEEVVGSNLRGDRGEFFTPRNICKMAVKMLDPDPKHFICDPAVGTGGFLTIAMNHVLRKIEASEKRKWKNPAAATMREQRELFQKIQDYANTHITGIDLNPNLVQAAKMNMVMNNDGSGALFQGNAYSGPRKLDHSVS
jgi:type I restriction enzyme M protein